jgi:hypothetical protein
MRVRVLLRYDVSDGEVDVSGAYMSQEAAMTAAGGFGAGSQWLEGGGLVVADWWQPGDGSDPSWYVTHAEVHPEFTWAAAQEALRLLRRILAGIARHGTMR